MHRQEISITEAEAALHESGARFVELFRHGSLSVEFYRPVGTDRQTPHDRDEIYVVAAGSGVFLNGDHRWAFKAGDFLFVPAGVVHRFEKFTEDFATWVFFYGPVGGEKDPEGAAAGTEEAPRMHE